MISIVSLDHLVITVKSLDRTIAFYRDVLGMKLETFGDDRKALIFGSQKINLHEVGNEIEPKAKVPTSGSADLCFISASPSEEIIRVLQQCSVAVVEGPVLRNGAVGTIESIYIRDPDQNLIEISRYLKDLILGAARIIHGLKLCPHSGYSALSLRKRPVVK